MSDQPGLSTTVLNDARSAVLYSVTKQSRKSRDGLDHRSLIEITNALISFDIREVREALDELQDEGLIWRQDSRKGEGWAVSTASPHPVDDLGIPCGSRKSTAKSLTNPRRGCEAAPQGSRTMGVRSDVGPQTDEDTGLGGPQTSPSYAGLLRTTPGGNGSARIVAGQYITRTRRRSAPSPDSPFGLATYFRQAGEDAGFVWGEFNQLALMRWFKQGLDIGMSADELRKLVDVFFLHPEAIRGTGKPPWKEFINQRIALAKQAGVTSHRQVRRAPAATTEEAMAEEKRRILEGLYLPEDHVPMTPEEMEADRARIMSWWTD